MTALRTRIGAAVLRPGHRDVVLVHPRGPDAATVLRDPTGVLTVAIRIAAAKDRRRNEEKKP